MQKSMGPNVNFYRSSYFNEVNRQLVEASQRGDKDFIKRHITFQDLKHLDLFKDELVENRYGMQVILSLAQSLGKQLNILDIGCGNAELLRVLSNAGHLVSGIDISPIRVDANQGKLKELVNSFAEKVPFHSERFDVIIALECLEHVMDLDLTLGEIFRLLKPGGLLLCQVPLDNFADGVNHLRHFDLQSLRRLCTLKGFEVLRIELVPYLIGEPSNNIFLIGTKPDATAVGGLAHAASYAFRRIMHPEMLTYGGIELTNNCNLSCVTCCTPKSKAPRGFATESTVRLGMDYAEPGQFFSFHRLGEPLLHKELIKYVRMASRYGLKPLISTNGLLLSERILAGLLEAGIRNLQITLHTIQSCIAYKITAELLRTNQISQSDIAFCGNLLSSNNKVMAWLDSLKVQSEDRVHIRHMGTHNWAGNVPGTKVDFTDETVRRRMLSCWFLKNNKCSIRWDGTVVACCFDSENDNVLGRVEDFPQLRHTPSRYKLCKHCDPNWANGELY